MPEIDYARKLAAEGMPEELNLLTEAGGTIDNGVDTIAVYVPAGAALSYPAEPCPDDIHLCGCRRRCHIEPDLEDERTGPGDQQAWETELHSA